MNRRQFALNLGRCLVACGAGRTTSFSAPRKQPEMAITLDDFNVYDTPGLSGAARNQAILDALDKYHLKAAIFVTGKHIDNEKNMSLLRLWDARGHLIGNHTYSHWEYPDVDFQAFSQDILRNERLLQPLAQYRKYFRFPYLKEGQTLAQRNRMRAFLQAHGYRNGHVTIDASDWYVDARLRDRLKKDPQSDLAPYREFYLSHLWDRARYYDDLARRVVGRSVKHTLLLHHNVLNGMFLGDVLRMFQRQGWKLINVEQAYTDPVFASAPNIVPAGESIIWAMAKERRKFDKILRYPAEDGEYEKPRMDALGL